MRNLAGPALFESFLAYSRVPLKDFGPYVERKSKQLKRASFMEAEQKGRPVKYLPSVQISKEEVARKIAPDDGISEGLICVLDRFADRLNPAHEEMLGPNAPSYYWTVYQTGWATDLMFRSVADLAAIYPALTRGSIALFGAKNVMRFLGQPPHWNLQGEVTSSFKHCVEGIQVKHYVRFNSVKAYDKHGSLLRIETTINDPRPFKVLRTKNQRSRWSQVPPINPAVCR